MMHGQKNIKSCRIVLKITHHIRRQKVSHLAPHSHLQYGVNFIKSTQKFDIQPMSYRHMPEGLYVDKTLAKYYFAKYDSHTSF
jgi:hypothetical protein